MEGTGMSYNEAISILERMRLEADASHLSHRREAIEIAIEAINNWQHYKRDIEDDLK